MSQNKEKMELSIGSVNINVIVPLDQQKLYTDACELVNNRLTEYQKVQNARGLDYQLSLVALGGPRSTERKITRLRQRRICVR